MAQGSELWTSGVSKTAVGTEHNSSIFSELGEVPGLRSVGPARSYTCMQPQEGDSRRMM